MRTTIPPQIGLCCILKCFIFMLIQARKLRPRKKKSLVMPTTKKKVIPV